MIPYSRQQISEADIEAVITVLKSDYLTQGETVPKLESALAGYCGVEYAVAACNATAALHLACLALGVDQDTSVWVPATSFVATASCARYCGARVDFVDVNPQNGLLCPEQLQKKLHQAKQDDCLPQVLIVVHLAGQSCDMQAISELCSSYNIRIIEDACHALGGRYQRRAVGSCAYSDCAVFSFHPVKPITTAEGGMLVTNSPAIAKRAALLANHGIVRDQAGFVNVASGDWYYEQQELGFNYRMSDLNAALGLSQLVRIDEFRQQRVLLAREYDLLLSKTDIQAVSAAPESDSAWHLYPVLFAAVGARNRAYERLRKQNFGVNIHYEPIPSQPYYQKYGFNIDDYSGAREYADRVLSLPLNYLMNNERQRKVVELCSLGD